MELITKNYKIVWRKSNFYKRLKKYPKVDSIELQRMKDKTLVGKPRKVLKNNFGNFVLRSDEIPNIDYTNATIDVISPAIKPGKFRWKGFYQQEIITFEMKDSTFRDHVLKGDANFSNRFSIEVEMTQKRKIDQDGSIKITNTIVNKVIAKMEQGTRTIYD